MSELIKPQNLTMSSDQISLIFPYLIMTFGAMSSLIAGVLKFTDDPASNQKKRNLTAASFSLLTLAATAYSISNVWGNVSGTLFNHMLATDYYSNLLNVLFVGATALVILSSWDYLEKENIHHPEYYSLMLFSCLGMMLLASSLDLIVLFISLEIMSIAVYVLVGFKRTDVRSNEASLKYFVLGAAVSAILLYGVAMIYGATGTMQLDQLGEWVRHSGNTNNPIFLVGAVLVLVGFLFKVAAVPFHMWMPDVYEGAPTTITNFMTTGLKAAAFASFLRVFMGLEIFMNTSFHNILWVAAVVTMFIGNVIALTQKNIKRMLAYSSIAHTGYILIGFISGGGSENGFSSVVLYLICYVIMNLGAFAIVSMLWEQGDKITDIKDFSGLGFKHPALGFAMTTFMFSMAGVPPTAGFAGKYLIFSSAVEANEIWLAVLGVLCSAISAYYYLRVIVYMYMKEPIREQKIHFALPTGFVVLLAAFGTLQFGFFPSMLIRAAKKAALNM